jgi:serpin B
MAASDAFAIALHHALAPERGNFVVAPIGLAVLLAMLQAGARGETARELVTALGGDDAITDLVGVLDRFADSDRSKAPIAVILDLLLAKDGLAIEPDFLTAMTGRFHARVERFDPRTPDAVTTRLDAWAREATDGAIPQVVTPEDLRPDLELLLANVVHFVGRWATSFDREKTYEGTFWLDDATPVKTRMMRHFDMPCAWAATEEWEMLRLGYHDQRHALELLVPARPNSSRMPFPHHGELGPPSKPSVTLRERESRWTADEFARLTAATRPMTVQVELPSFELHGDHDLMRVLPALGIRRSSDPAHADLRGILRDGPLALGQLRQRCRIQTDEAGTRASAVSFAGLLKGVPPCFRADRPFLFVLRDTESGAVLFCGRVADPRG